MEKNWYRLVKNWKWPLNRQVTTRWCIALHTIKLLSRIFAVSSLVAKILTRNRLPCSAYTKTPLIRHLRLFEINFPFKAIRSTFHCSIKTRSLLFYLSLNTVSYTEVNRYVTQGAGSNFIQETYHRQRNATHANLSTIRKFQNFAAQGKSRIRDRLRTGNSRGMSRRRERRAAGR